MENYQYSSYPDSVNSSPRSSHENSTWEEQNYKVKLVCSYGGKIQPRPHDNQLTYVGGDTKILAVERNIKFTSFISKLTSLLSDCEISFKYQLPGEDLDALISVTNDEDLEHMMLEYDRLCKNSAKPARLRLFLFQLKPPPPALTSSFGSTESKSERQWFVDALNSVNLEAASPPSAAAAVDNPDFLFGLEKGHAPEDEAAKERNQAPAVNEAVGREVYGGGDGREVVGAQQVVSAAEYQQQIEELQRLQISGHDQSTRVYGGEYGGNNYQRSVTPPPQTAVPVSNQAAYWPDRHVASGQYSVPPNEQPVYLIQTAAGVYQAPAMRQVTGQVGQGYYGLQRMVPDVYREQPVYNGVPQQAQIQQPNYSGAYNSEAVGMVRAPHEASYAAQVSYDSAGRPVYYTAPGV